MLLLFVGCAGQRQLDGSTLEAEIASQLLPEYPGAIRSLSCPDSNDPQPGQSLLCIATLGAQVIDVNVVLGGTTEELTSTAKIDDRFVAINEVAALLAATFGDEVGIATSVDCGQPVVVLAPDETVLCTATDPTGIARLFDVSVDSEGVIDLRLR